MYSGGSSADSAGSFSGWLAAWWVYFFPNTGNDDNTLSQGLLAHSHLLEHPDGGRHAAGAGAATAAGGEVVGAHGDDDAKPQPGTARHIELSVMNSSARYTQQHRPSPSHAVLSPTSSTSSLYGILSLSPKGPYQTKQCAYTAWLTFAAFIYAIAMTGINLHSFVTGFLPTSQADNVTDVSNMSTATNQTIATPSAPGCFNQTNGLLHHLITHDLKYDTSTDSYRNTVETILATLLPFIFLLTFLTRLRSFVAGRTKKKKNDRATTKQIVLAHILFIFTIPACLAAAVSTYGGAYKAIKSSTGSDAAAILAGLAAFGLQVYTFIHFNLKGARNNLVNALAEGHFREYWGTTLLSLLYTLVGGGTAFFSIQLSLSSLESSLASLGVSTGFNDDMSICLGLGLGNASLAILTSIVTRAATAVRIRAGGFGLLYPRASTIYGKILYCLACLIAAGDFFAMLISNSQMLFDTLNNVYLATSSQGEDIYQQPSGILFWGFAGLSFISSLVGTFINSFCYNATILLLFVARWAEKESGYTDRQLPKTHGSWLNSSDNSDAPPVTSNDRLHGPTTSCLHRLWCCSERRSATRRRVSTILEHATTHDNASANAGDSSAAADNGTPPRPSSQGSGFGHFDTLRGYSPARPTTGRGSARRSPPSDDGAASPAHLIAGTGNSAQARGTPPHGIPGAAP